MRLKRSTMAPCPSCKTSKHLDLRTDYGGARYVDLYYVNCEWCGIRTERKITTKEALDAWEAKHRNPASVQDEKGK